jgi:hypothetical protein
VEVGGQRRSEIGDGEEEAFEQADDAQRDGWWVASMTTKPFASSKATYPRMTMAMRNGSSGPVENSTKKDTPSTVPRSASATSVHSRRT